MSRRNGQVAQELREILDDDASLVHETYRHLDRRITLLAGLTISQTIQLVLSGLAAYALCKWLPLGSPLNFEVGVTLAGLPVTLSFALAYSDVNLDVAATLRGLLAWRRQRGIYEPGCDPAAAHGYRLATREPEPDPAAPGDSTTRSTELEDLLWH